MKVVKKRKDGVVQSYNEGLSRDELNELASLINMTDVSGVFGVNDLVRRSQLEKKATEEQLWFAAKNAGLSREEFEDTYQ